MSGPRAVICYICGRQYGTRSIDIHLKTCKRMWEATESRKPKHERRPLPQAPDVPVAASTMTAAERLEARNAAAFEQFNSKAMASCENCGRTFLPDRLVIHQRSCRPDNPARRIGDVGFGGAGAPRHKIRGGDGDMSSSSRMPARPSTSSGPSSGPYEPVLGGSGSDYPRPATTKPKRRGPRPGAGRSPGRGAEQRLAATAPPEDFDDYSAPAPAATLRPHRGGGGGVSASASGGGTYGAAGANTVAALEAHINTMERYMLKMADEMAKARQLLGSLKSGASGPSAETSSSRRLSRDRLAHGAVDVETGGDVVEETLTV